MIDKRVTATDVDLVFAKVKAKGQRKIGFDEFRAGLAALAKLKFSGKSDAEATAELEELVLHAGGPAATATVSLPAVSMA